MAVKYCDSRSIGKSKKKVENIILQNIKLNTAQRTKNYSEKFKNKKK